MKNGEMECLKYVIDALKQQNNGEVVFTNIEDSNLLLKLLNGIKPNQNEAEFPDFISSDVIVEHFSVTSSKENKKGSSFKKEESINDKENQKIIKDWKDCCTKLPIKGNAITTNVIENTYSDLSYEYFINSFNKNLLHHIKSLKKYHIDNKKVIFLIELQDALMGIYRHDAFYKFYELNKDKKALFVLKSFVNLLDVVIFRASDRIELIDMKKCDELYEFSYCEEDIRGGRHRSISLMLNMDINII